MNATDMDNAPRDVIIISSPRSGTNFFCECIGSLTGVTSYFEVFNPRGVMGAGDARTLATLSAKLKKPVLSAKDPGLLAYFADSPLDGLGLLRGHARGQGAQVLSYKIFPNQLSPEMLEAILRRPGALVVFIVRQRLQTFISYKKATTRDVWKNAETGDQLVEIDAAEFISWGRRIDRWYAEARDLVEAHGIDHAIWSYEDDIDAPKPQVIDRIAAMLQERGLELESTDEARKVKFRKQDLPVGPFKKISNGEALRAALRDHRAYNYALANPFEDTAQPKQP